MSTDLISRIEKALSADKPTSSELTALLGETAQQITVANQERAAALDPTSPADDAALQRVATMTLVKNRLAASVKLLQAKLAEAEKRERIAVYREGVEVLRPEGLSLTQELSAFYPTVCEKWIDLSRRLENYKQRVSKHHSECPSGVSERLPDPELEARGSTSFNAEFKPLAKEIRLVDFKTGKQIFPPKSTSTYASMFLPIDYGARYSSDWHKAQEEDNAKRRQLAAQRLREQEKQDQADRLAFETRTVKTG